VQPDRVSARHWIGRQLTNLKTIVAPRCRRVRAFSL
jgi:hypothetical protein